MEIIPPAGGSTGARAAQLESLVMDQAIRLAIVNQGRLLITTPEGALLPGAEEAVHKTVRSLGTLNLSLFRINRAYGADMGFKAARACPDPAEPRQSEHAKDVTRILRGDPDAANRAAEAEVRSRLDDLGKSYADIVEEDEAWVAAMEARLIALDPLWPDRDSFIETFRMKRERERAADPEAFEAARAEKHAREKAEEQAETDARIRAEMDALFAAAEAAGEAGDVAADSDAPLETKSMPFSEASAATFNSPSRAKPANCDVQFAGLEHGPVINAALTVVGHEDPPPPPPRCSRPLAGGDRRAARAPEGGMCGQRSPRFFAPFPRCAGTSPVSTGEDERAKAVRCIFPRLIAGEVPGEAGGRGRCSAPPRCEGGSHR